MEIWLVFKAKKVIIKYLRIQKGFVGFMEYWIQKEQKPVLRQFQSIRSLEMFEDLSLHQNESSWCLWNSRRVKIQVGQELKQSIQPFGRCILKSEALPNLGHKARDGGPASWWVGSQAPWPGVSLKTPTDQAHVEAWPMPLHSFKWRVCPKKP